MLVCSQKTGKKGPDAVRSRPCSRNYKTDGICRQEGRPSNTGSQNNKTPTQQSYRHLDTSRQKYREKKKIKVSIVEKTKERWYRKRMHGQLPRNLNEKKLVDIEQSYR